MSDKKREKKVCGIHLSGPGSKKTCLVVMKKNLRSSVAKVTKIYDHIGSQGMIFSDDRLIRILELEAPMDEVFVDCPLTNPPCVSCTRPICPGVNHCDDISVAFLLSLAKKMKSTKKMRRPINPQNQRLVDIYRLVYEGVSDTTYSANLAPLVVRAQTLQRRINGTELPVSLKETSVKQAIIAIGQMIGMERTISKKFKNFERGSAIRHQFITQLQAHQIVHFSEASIADRLLNSADSFSAFITSLVAIIYLSEGCEEKPKFLTPENGWIYLPIDKKDETS